MKMAELSRRTGVPVPTIKYYLREGLLPPGVRTSRNQADYDESHVRRLSVIRSLVEVAKLPLATIKEVLAKVDSPDQQLHDAFGVAQRSVTAEWSSIDETHRDAAAAMLQKVISERGWNVHTTSPAYRTSVSVLATYLALGSDDLTATLPRYAEAAELIGAADIDALVGRSGDLERQIEAVVIGTLVGDQLIAALRRLAQEDLSRRTFGGAPPAD